MKNNNRKLECEICGTSEIKSLFYSRNIMNETCVLSKCKECSFIFKSSSSKTKLNILDGEYYESKSVGSVVDDRFIKHFTRRAKSHYDYIKVYHTNQKKRALDIGCGAGFFLSELNRDNWITKGIEPDPIMCEYGKKQGLDIKNTLFEDYQSSEKFGLVYLSHVIDDLPNINVILSKIHSLLVDNGLLFVEVPNFESKFRLDNVKDEDLSVGHYFFTRNSLHSLMNKNGFKLLDQHTYSPVYLNTKLQIMTSPIQFLSKFLPSKMKPCIRGIFVKKSRG